MTKKDFVLRLKNLREKTGLSQLALIAQVKIAPRAYHYYESINNTRIPEYKNLIKLADFFNCSIDYLLCKTDNPKRNY